MPVIARDAVASDHLVFAWPFPIGPEEHEVSCAEDELVVMCPSFMVGDRLGPGRHRWRTPDPMRPVSAYFVLTAPVEVSFDMITQFLMPSTGQGVRIRASGSLQVRCMDPALLIAQFVGLPFDHVNDGVLRSVSRSVERMLARLLTRRVVMAGTPNAVTDPQMLPNIIEELVAYNPAAGAVFGVELVRMGYVSILADDGSRPWQQMTASGSNPRLPANGDTMRRMPEPASLVETARQVPAPQASVQPTPTPAINKHPRAQSQPQVETSGEIVVKSKDKPNERSEKTTAPGHAAAPMTQSETVPDPLRVITTPVPRRAAPLDVPHSTEEETQPDRNLMRSTANDAKPTPPEPRSAIMGIGVSPIGSAGASSGGSSSASGPTASGEITKKIAPGGRVLVAGPNGLMQSATVRQLLQGYYELEVGGSGETIWVPINNVVPE
ncbi:MAG TPA: hypothetical protein VIV40_05270 [Kofleriaceae bacterium]